MLHRDVSYEFINSGFKKKLTIKYEMVSANI